jgi:hypothetical protein
VTNLNGIAKFSGGVWSALPNNGLNGSVSALAVSGSGDLYMGGVFSATANGAVPPLLLKTDANPNGLPIDVIDQLRAGVRADRAQFFSDFSIPFYGFNRPGAKVSQGLRDAFFSQAVLAGA